VNQRIFRSVSKAGGISPRLIATSCFVSSALISCKSPTQGKESYLLAYDKLDSQRGPNAEYGQEEYKKAGAENQPFHDDGIEEYGTTRASDHTISPEDFPWRSIRVQDGQHRYLTGGPFEQQKGKLATAFAREGAISADTI
jgi:hypothetical protein